MNRSPVLCAAVLALLSACGGGSGGGNRIEPSSLLKISPANAARASRVAYESVVAGAGMSDMSGEAGLFASQPGTVSAPGGSFGGAAKITGSSQVPIPETTEACDVSGFVTVSGNIEDPFTPTLTAGDFFDLDFDNCDDGLGDVTDGLLHLEVFAFAGDFVGGLYDFTMDFEMSDFRVAAAGHTESINGDVRVALDTTATPYVEAAVSGDLLTIDTDARSVSLFDFVSLQTVDAGVSPSPYTLTASGTLDSTELTGSIDYSTPVPFAGFDAGYPAAGELLVSGLASSALLTVLEDGSLRIDVDTDGNGSTDTTIFTTWEALRNQ